MACLLLGTLEAKVLTGYCLSCIGTCCSGPAGSQTWLLPGLGMELNRATKAGQGWACDGTLAANQPTLLGTQRPADHMLLL